MVWRVSSTAVFEADGVPVCAKAFVFRHGGAANKAEAYYACDDAFEVRHAGLLYWLKMDERAGASNFRVCQHVQ